MPTLQESNDPNTPLNKIRRERLIILALTGLLLLNYPLISLFGRPILIMGIPLLYIYIFTVWLVFIIFIRRMLQSAMDKDR